MERIIIEGGIPLQGTVRISGAKNAALPILAASLLSQELCSLSNVPDLRDVTTMERLLKGLGVEIDKTPSGTWRLDPTKITGFEAPYEVVRTMRASVLVLGPLIARFGRADVSLPGGCAIGARPINLHLMGLEKLGASLRIEKGYVCASSKRLEGTRIYLDLPTVTGTMNLMMAATLARGTTLIENAACEPEVRELADALGSMGARIEGAGTDRIEIEGVETLGGMDYSVMPDRIEAGTFLTAGAITGGNVTLSGCRPAHLEAVTEKLLETGVMMEVGPDELRVLPSGRLRAVDVKTGGYPAFATDMQAQFMALMTLAEGTSVITESVFENRFMHVAELRRMGADIKVQGNSAIVRGVHRLNGAPVMATDLRASASLILAGLAAQGRTIISRVYHLDRGYERMEEKFQGLGAAIRREKES
ncbi:MAG: UDP-N-acetylglucosamine 1-carboxyvinyltransferase [Deltaproteobacteria bacterium]|nr:UDP-N-acetylglucosamine 1-carboxyvinyltransferase [Deltaproteobacteria bacterium]